MTVDGVRAGTHYATKWVAGGINRVGLIVLLAVGIVLMAMAGASSAQAATNVLVFTGGATNSSVAAASAALEDVGEDRDINVTVTDEATQFTGAGLANYQAVVLLHNTGNPLSAAQQGALNSFVLDGGGLLTIGEAIGMHAGVANFNNLFGIATGNRISSVAGTPSYTVEAGDRVHPASKDLPLTFMRSGQWYSYTSNPTGTSHSILRIRTGDQTITGDGTIAASRPIAWCRDQQNGRTFYTGLGGSVADWTDANVLEHIGGALEWTSGVTRGGCKATINSNYSTTRLNNRPSGLALNGESHGITAAPNGWMIYIGRADCVDGAERGQKLAPPTGTSGRVLAFNTPNVGVGCGTVHVFDPEAYTGAINTGVTRAATLAVYGDRGGGDERNGKIETGLLGITVAPNFATTGHVYLQYFPTFNPNTVPPGLSDGDQRRVTKIGKGRISRFTMNLQTKQLDMSSEVKIFEYDSQIYSCCHRGGGMGFDSAGNLYVTTGDSNSSQNTDGYSGNSQANRCPTNGSADPAAATGNDCGNNPANAVSYQDARRTAGNTNDYNGKMLRIKPNPAATSSTPIGIGSTYDIPGPSDPNGPNLFSGFETQNGQPTGAGTRGQFAKPEIYAMGLRNPSRLSIDPNTDVPYSAWVGPDAGSPSATSGPSTYEVATRLASAGNYGWPYCMGGGRDGKAQAYRDRTSAGGSPLRTDNTGGYVVGGPAAGGTNGWYDCDNVVNDSSNNTGISGALPHSTGTGKDAGKARPTSLWYSRGNPNGANGCPEFPRDRGATNAPNFGSSNVNQLCPYITSSGMTVMNGPVYGYEEGADNSRRWPEYWNSRWFVHDHGNNSVRHAMLMPPANGHDGDQPVWADNLKSLTSWGNSYMDSKFGADGALYVQVYDGFFTAGGNVGLFRVSYNGGADTPNANVTFETIGPRQYRFSSAGSGGVSYEWDFDDGTTSTQANPEHTFSENGVYDVQLTVTYGDGEELVRTVTVTASAGDVTAPTSTATVNPASPNGPGGAYIGPVTITLASTDNEGGSGVETLEWRNGSSGAFQPYSGPITITELGQTRVQFRARDAAGNQEAIKQVVVRITEEQFPQTNCLRGSDEFNGTSLNSRWQVLRPEPGDVSFNNGHLRVMMRGGDLSATVNSSQNTIIQEIPDGQWTATVKIDLTQLNQTNDQAGIAFFRPDAGGGFNSTGSLKKVVWNRRSSTTWWTETHPSGGASAAVTSNPTTLLLRVSSDGAANPTLTTRRSIDNGATWANAGSSTATSAFTVPGDTNQPIYMGLATFQSLSYTGSDRSTGFDFSRVTRPADTAPDGQPPTACVAVNNCTTQTDEFDGSTLDPKWTVLRSEGVGPTVGGGNLTLPTLGGDYHENNAPKASNTLLQQMPNGTWSATTKINVSDINTNGRQAGLVVVKSENPAGPGNVPPGPNNTFAKLVFAQYTPSLWAMEFGVTVDGVLTTGSGEAHWQRAFEIPAMPTQDILLRLRSTGTAVIGEFSLDAGQTWRRASRDLPESHQAPFATTAESPTWVGPVAFGGGGGNIPFDWFHVTPFENQWQCQPSGGDDEPPTTTHAIDPASPDGPDNWYVTAPEVTLNATDAGEAGVDETEYRIGTSGDFLPYDGPFEVTQDGNITVQYRSVDKMGNLESTKSFSFRKDANAPTTTAILDPDEPNGPAGNYTGPVTVDLEADDAGGSGVETTQYRVDGGEWKTYVKEEMILDNQADLSNWVMDGPGSFNWNPPAGDQDGFFRTAGGLGLLWFPKEYGDFHLKMKWRDSSTGSNGNGGVFIRFPDPRIPLAQRPTTGPGAYTGTYCGRVGSAATSGTWLAINCGHEIQINDYQSDTIRTGSVYLFKNIGAAQGNPQNQPRGTWVDYEIRVEGQMYTIIRNGQVINTFNNANPESTGGTTQPSRAGDPPTTARQFASGFVGLQNHGGSDLVDYRDVSITPLVDGAQEGPFTVSGNGEHTVEFRSTDKLGNVEETKSVEFCIGTVCEPVTDPDAPVTTATVAPVAPDGNAGWYKTPPTVTLTGNDGSGSGVKRTEYSTNGGTTWTAAPAPFVYSTEGNVNVLYRSVDNQDNVETAKTLNIKLDTAPPTSNAQLSPAYPGPGQTYPTTSPVSFSLSSTDSASGVARIEYRVGGGAFATYTGPVNVTGEGDFLVEYRGVDTAGNVEATRELEFSIDADAEEPTDPVVPVIVNPSDPPVTINLQSFTGDVALIEYKLQYSRNGGATWEAQEPWTLYSGPLQYTVPGKYILYYRSQSTNGAWSSVSPVPFAIAGTPPKPTALKIVATPKEKRVKAGKVVTATVKITNTGNATASDVQLCALVSKSSAKLQGAKCRTATSLAPGTTWTVKVKIKKTKQGKMTRPEFVVTSPDAASVKTNTRIRLK